MLIRLRNCPRQLPYYGFSTMSRKTELSWETVNTADPAEMAEFRVQQERLANERVKAAFERLKSLGIIDEHGESVGEELPPDMHSGAKRDFGG
jgi:hypothetical protein